MTAINAALIATVSTETIQTPQVTLVSLVTANTEYTAAFPTGTKSFALQNRDDGVIKLKTAAAGNHWTLFPGQPYYISNVKGAAAVTFYLESPKALQTVEILSWS